jgi:O-antigen biosynthesis alpha-1,2-mannosyltransferase
LKNFTILTDYHRGSYEIIGNLFQNTLQQLGEVRNLPTPVSLKERRDLALGLKGRIVFHNTLGDQFIPFKDSYNIAMPLHEWSEYPKEWIKLLNQFDEVWTTTDHIQEVLKRGGLIAPVFLLPPALDSEDITEKKSWEISDKPRFLFVGEPHFRKGNHLLMQGFMKAFPAAGSALLTIKTSPSCSWDSPREDIILIKEKWSRDKLLKEYSNHDCFISASLAEGLGLPIAEAIMAKLPICTNFWGGHKSLLTRGGFIEIEHEEIIQPFTSDPAFYAEDQKCAYSSPQEIEKSMKLFNNTSLSERKKMAFAAKENFLKSYGNENTLRNIHSRILEISKK